MFVGRAREIAALRKLLSRAWDQRDSNPGKALLVRGRRRVGKSRLLEEFIATTGAPSLFFAASGRPVREELRLFTQEAAGSTLPGAALFDGVELDSWDTALRLLAAAVPGDGPSVVVLDEIPYMISQDTNFEGTLQRAFDRDLSRKPVLLVGIGSDLSMMEALNEYGRPFHQRATEMVVPPLSPAEVASMMGLAPAEAFDAYLVTGGLPLICAEWESGMSLRQYLQEAVPDPTSALLVSAERSLAAEFPPDAQAATVLRAVGSGERTFTNIGRAAGDIQQPSLSRSLKLLAQKRIISVDLPLSTKVSREKRYRITDPYLRFWLSFLGPRMNEIERGRGDRVLAQIDASWTSWRGRVIEPVLRDALERLAPPLVGDTEGAMGHIGAYWTRTNTPVIDVVVGDRAPVAQRILGLGSVKWLDKAPFDAHDLDELQAHRAQVPGAGADTPLIAISRSGSSVAGVECFGPEDLLASYADSGDV